MARRGRPRGRPYIYPYEQTAQGLRWREGRGFPFINAPQGLQENLESNAPVWSFDEENRRRSIRLHQQRAAPPAPFRAVAPPPPPPPPPYRGRPRPYPPRVVRPRQPVSVDFGPSMARKTPSALRFSEDYDSEIDSGTTESLSNMASDDDTEIDEEMDVDQLYPVPQQPQLQTRQVARKSGGGFPPGTVQEAPPGLSHGVAGTFNPAGLRRSARVQRSNHPYRR